MTRLALAIGAHPDDIEIGCGGTLCLLRDRGYEIVHLIVTSGEEGALDRDRSDLARQRQAESRSAAEIIGAREVIFLDVPDGSTSYSKEIKVQLIALLRNLRPEIVFTHAKSDQFPDHALVHKLVMGALAVCGGPWYPEAPGAPHQVQTVLGYEVWNPIPVFQTAVNIEATFDRKLAALRQHASQIETVNYLEAVSGLARYRGVMSLSGAYAEVFEVMRAAALI